VELLNGINGKVLDVGCGPGVMVEDLTGLGCEIYAVDAAPRMVEECYRRFGHLPQVHCSVGSATALNFTDESFDAVLCMGVIDRIPSYKLALKEMVRVVKANGSLIIAFPNLLSPYASWKNFIFYPAVGLMQKIYFRSIGCKRPPSLLSSLAILHTARGAISILSKYGVCIDRVVYYYYNPFLSPLDEIFPRYTLQAVYRLERLYAGSLKWLGAGFILKAEKRP
jgi:SAM-dependent methyltransferase